jgi:outer membrane protein assembly factor BamB
MRVNYRILPLIAGFVLAGCNLNLGQGNLKPLPATDMKSNWHQHYYVESKDLKRLLPYRSKDLVYTADTKGFVHVYSADKGKLVWKKSFEKKSFISGPILFKDTLYIGTKTAKLLAISALRDAELKWEASLASLANAPVEVGHGLVFVRTQDGMLSALDQKTGVLVWRYVKENPVLTLPTASRPVLSSYGLLLASADGRLVCLAPETGEVLWESFVSMPRGRSEVERMVDSIADPVVVKDLAFVASYQGNISAIHLQTGNIAWQQELSTWEQLLVLPGQLIASTTKGEVIAFDINRGDILWRQEALVARNLSAPIAVGTSYIVVGDGLGQLHWLSENEGTLLKTTQAIKEPILKIENTPTGILITTEAGKIRELALPDLAKD